VPRPHISAVVLAAGLSKRMGAFKPLLPLDGKALLVHVIETLQAVDEIRTILVVTGHEERRLKAALQSAPVSFVHNAAYASGEMLSSVQAGLRALPADVEAVVLALGDQPAVQPETVRRLVRTWLEQKPALVLPVFHGRRGHPLLLCMSLRAEILALPKNATLKTAVHRHLGEAVQIAVDDAAVTADVDTPEDYQRAQREGQLASGEWRVTS
jgi:molybdenum cofactor cytidylyltransferase